MPKKSVTPTLQSWDDANAALLQIGQNRRAVELIEADMQDKIDTAKKTAQEEAGSYILHTEILEKQLNQFVTAHRAELGNKKSKTLVFGTVGYRKSTKISLPRAQDKQNEIIAKLKKLGMTDCIITPPQRIDREALKKQSDERIKQAGATVTTGDSFFYEVSQERLEKS